MVRTHILSNNSSALYRIRTANFARASSLFGVRHFDIIGYGFVCVDRNLNRVGNLFVCVNWNLDRVRNLFLGCYRNLYVVGLNDINVMWNLNGVGLYLLDSRRDSNSVRLYFWNCFANSNLIRLLLNDSRWNLNCVALHSIGVNRFVSGIRNFFRYGLGNVDLIGFFDLARNCIIHRVSDLLCFLFWNHHSRCAGFGFSAWHLTSYGVSPSPWFGLISGLVDRSHFGSLRRDHDGLFNVADLIAATTCIAATNNPTANNASGTGCIAATAITRKNTTGPK